MSQYATTRDGRKLRYYRQGTGDPVVILEAGSGGTARSWLLVMDQLAASSTVIAYDRSGLGSSDPDRAPRDLARMVDDLEDLVDAVAPGRRYVLVGHSLGGPICRMYAYRHPDRVAGMVLADPTSEDMTDFFKGPQMWVTGALFRTAALLAGLGVWEGMVRRRWVLAEYERVFQLLPASERDAVRQEMCTPLALRTSRREHSQVHNDLRQLSQAIADNPLPAMPVTVISGEHITKTEAKIRPKVVRIHAEYVQGLPQGRHVRTPLAGHLVPQDDPQLVIDETLRILELARNG